MKLYACLTCGRPSPGKRCPEHQGTGTGWSHNRDRQAQADFRSALLIRAGGRCEEIEHGVRCSETSDLRACHIVPLSEGGTYAASNGLLRCKMHDRATDSRAR